MDDKDAPPVTSQTTRRKPQLSLRALLATVTLFTLSFGLMATADRYDSSVGALCGLTGTLLFGASLGFPIGYLLNRRHGALVGALLGALGVLIILLAFGVYIRNVMVD